MERAEALLKDYYYLKKESKGLMTDLSIAKHAYEHSMSELPSSCRYSVVKTKDKRIAKPVEANVMIMLDEYWAQVESIKKRLEDTRTQIERIEKAICKAGLDARQREYITLRYFSNLSAEAVSQRMYCSTSTCRRIRRTVLQRIEEAIKEPA